MAISNYFLESTLLYHPGYLKKYGYPKSISKPGHLKTWPSQTTFWSRPYFIILAILKKM
jgi:hypothetical protein